MSTLRQLLNSQDAALGPWVPGRDPLEDALSAFAGAPGGPSAHPWMAGLIAGPASNPGAICLQFCLVNHAEVDVRPGCQVRGYDAYVGSKSGCWGRFWAWDGSG